MGGTICYMNETGITLSGNNVYEDNLAIFKIYDFDFSEQRVEVMPA